MNATMEQQNAAAAYVMPAVEIGDEVYWYADGDGRVAPSVAKVLVVNPNSVDVQVLTRDATIRKWGVHHVEDPIVKLSRDVRNNGAWRHSPKNDRIAELEARVKTLEDLV